MLRWEVQAVLSAAASHTTADLGSLQATGRALSLLLSQLMQHRELVVGRAEIRHHASQVVNWKILPALLDCTSTQQACVRAIAVMTRLFPELVPRECVPQLIVHLNCKHAETECAASSAILSFIVHSHMDIVWPHWIAKKGSKRLLGAMHAALPHAMQDKAVVCSCNQANASVVCNHVGGMYGAYRRSCRVLMKPSQGNRTARPLVPARLFLLPHMKPMGMVYLFPAPASPPAGCCGVVYHGLVLMLKLVDFSPEALLEICGGWNDSGGESWCPLLLDCMQTLDQKPGIKLHAQGQHGQAKLLWDGEGGDERCSDDWGRGL
eukprot:gene31220-6370_t